MKHNPDVDRYFESVADSVKPIVLHLRAVFHATCPDVHESIKWSAPHFEYKGILAQVAAFKGHVRLAFWKGDLMQDPTAYLKRMGESRMGVVRLETMQDLPPDDVLRDLILEAVDLNERGVKAPRAVSRLDELDVPAWFMERIEKDPNALATWKGFSRSHRNEYVEWVTDAKQETTRERRLQQAIQWMSEGKPKEWRYMKEWK